MFRNLGLIFDKIQHAKPFYLCKRQFMMREPSQPLKRCPKWVCVEDAVKIINSEHLVFVQGGAATPTELVRAMTEHGVCNNLRSVRLLHTCVEGDMPYANAQFEKHFRSICLYVGTNLREAVNSGRADYIPLSLHDTPRLFSNKKLMPDIALIHVSMPDARGFCSLGVTVGCTRAAVSVAKVLIAQVNEYMPRSFGDTVIHSSHFDWAVRYDCPLPNLINSPPNNLENEIGKIIAHRLIDDGATLQVGFGNIPDAILNNLSNHKDLGIHSDVLCDSMVDLVEHGNITNRYKNRHRGRMIGTMAVGTKRLYDFLHNNPFSELLGVNYVNDPRIIAMQPNMRTINSCIEMDLTGQVCSDSLGCKIYSGFGSQLDFLQGASQSQDGNGRAIIAFPSVTNKGESRIQPMLKAGSGVVVPRANVNYIVTEHGVAQLFGKTLRQRANALIQIAHPDHRECLEKAAFDRLKCNPTKYL